MKYIYKDLRIAYIGVSGVFKIRKIISDAKAYFSDFDKANIVVIGDEDYEKFVNKIYRYDLRLLEISLQGRKNVQVIKESEFIKNLSESGVKIRFKGRSVREQIDDYTVVDLETTGRSMNPGDITEMSALKIRAGEITDKFSVLVRPENEILPDIIKLTGITNEMVENAPGINEVIDDYINFIGDDIILGHNIAAFDANLIYDAYFGYCGKYFDNDMLDTYHYARKCSVDLPNLKLTTIAEHFNIDTKGAHRALNDCTINYLCYEKLKPLYSGRNTEEITAKASVENHDDVSINMDVNGAAICLTGDFKRIPRDELESRLEEMGAVIKSGVSSKVDYLIVGGLGSKGWAFGSSGSKEKKALELQQKGKNIKIIKESEFLK